MSAEPTAEVSGGGSPPGDLPGSLLAFSIVSVATLAAFGVLASSGDAGIAFSRVLAPAAVALIVLVAATGTGAGAIFLFRRLADALSFRRSGSAATSESERRNGETAPVEIPRSRRDVGMTEAGRFTLSISLIVGYPLLGALLFLSALISTSMLNLLLPLALGSAGWLVIAHGRRSEERRPSRERSPWLVALLFLPILWTLLATALLPAVSLDEVSYHLAIPKIWLSMGQAVELPLMSHSYFPLATEAVDLLPLALLSTGGAIASHLVHAAIAIAAVVLMLRICRGGALGVVSVAAIASTPAALLVGGWSNTDVPLVAVSIVLFAALDRLMEAGEGMGEAAAALAAGLMIKYTFLPVSGILIGAALIESLRRRSDQAGTGREAATGAAIPVIPTAILAAVFGVAAGIGSLFLVRNLLLTGNPVEPFLTGAGGEIARFRWSGSWSGTLSSYLFDPRFIDDSLGFVLPAMALASLVLVRTMGSHWRRFVVVVLLLAVVALSWIGPAGRILFPFLIIPALIAIGELSRRLTGVARVVLLAILAFAGALQLGVCWLHLDRLDPLSVVSGSVESERWLESQRGMQARIVDGSALLQPDERTLVLGVQELFWFDGAVTGGANFDSDRISRYLEGSGEELHRRWMRDGIDAVLLYPRQIAVGEDPQRSFERQRILRLTPAAAASLAETLRNRSTVAARGEDVILYRVEP